MTDILIADYSSIAVEYSLLNRPIILYAFDKDWYLSKDRGFYFDYEKTAPGPIVENMQDLIDCIKNKQWDIAKVEKFAHLHNDYFDDKSAERVVDYYFAMAKSCRILRRNRNHSMKSGINTAQNTAEREILTASARIFLIMLPAKARTENSPKNGQHRMPKKP